MKSCAWASWAACFNFVLGGIRLAEGDILANRGGEQGRLLQHHARSGCAANCRVDAADIHPIDGDASGGGVVEAGDQVDHGGFPGTGRAEQGDDLVGLGFEGDILQYVAVPSIGEGDVLETDVTRLHVQGWRSWHFCHLRHRIQDFKNAFGGGAGHRNGRQDHAK